jgi:hypothetical protein
MDRQFDDIVDTCVDRILKGDTIEGCLERYPEHASELEPVLRAAVSVAGVRSIRPREEFHKTARARLLSSVEGSLTGRRGLAGLGMRRGWVVAVAVILALLLVGGGTVTAASVNSLPGDLLYPVKTAGERVESFFTFGRENKASFHVRIAERRLREIEALAERHRLIPASVMEAMNSETDRAIDILRQNQVTRREVVVKLVDLTAEQKSALRRVIESYPVEVRSRSIEALQRSELLHIRALELDTTIPGLERLKIGPWTYSLSATDAAPPGGVSQSSQRLTLGLGPGTTSPDAP